MIPPNQNLAWTAVVDTISPDQNLAWTTAVDAILLRRLLALDYRRILYNHLVNGI